MSNLSSRVTLYDIQTLSNVLLAMDQYILISLYTIGMLGSILNLLTFLQKQIRSNTCSMYFLATSITDMCTMQIIVLTQIIATYHPNVINRMYATDTWCKLGNYFIFIFPCLSSSYMALASFDRLCASSLNSTIRKYSRVKIGRIFTGLTFLFWVLFGLHIPIAYSYVTNSLTNVSACTVLTSSSTIFIIIDGFFFALYNGAIIPFLLCVFGWWIFFNVRTSRRRVHAQTQNGLHHLTRQNVHMIRMVLFQVILTIFLNIPYIVIYLLGFFQKIPTDLLCLYVLILFTFIARWFYYLNFCKNFYINTLTSAYFRESLHKQFVHIVRQRRFTVILRSAAHINTNTN